MAAVISVIVKILAAVLIFGLVIFIHEFGHFFAAKKCGVKVNEFALGMGPALFKKQKGETLYALRAFPIGGFVSMEGEDENSDDPRSFQRAPAYKRFLIVVAGALMNLVLGFLVLIILTSSLNAIPTKIIAKFDENATSEASGLQVGDEILAVNGRHCYVMDDVTYEFMRIEDGVAEFTVRRNGEKITLPNVKFDVTYEEDVGNIIVQDYYLKGEKKNPLNVVSYAANWGICLGRMIFRSFVDLIAGHVKVSSLSGPIGIVTVISEAVDMGWRPVVMFLALITINLGIFNLIPFPALDGGKLFLIIIEAIRRKPINQKYENIINVVGFACLIGLMIFVSISDVTKLFS